MAARHGRFGGGMGAWAVLGAASVAVLALAASARPSRSDAPDVTAPKATPEQAEFFEKRVRPVLIANCVSCHGPDAQIAGLRLDSRAAILKGGDGGTSLIPGDPDKSLLIEVIRHTGKVKMPQGGKLKESEIADLTEWIKQGAPWPDNAPAAATTSGKGKKAAPLWSLSPVKKPVPPKVKAVAPVTSPIDAFIIARLEAKGLTLAPLADKRILLRRVTFDLTGLPPTLAETQVFLADTSPQAYERVVDRLLNSPRYGERQARLWLDVARYADTKGYVFNEDRNYYHSYTYRDYVIRAFNSNLPYDQFLTEQLAADLLPHVKNGDDKRPLAALGYLTLGRRFIQQRPDIIDDRIDVTMRGMQGLTVSCARCHDHKFDPIPTQDYYSLYGVFDSTSEGEAPISEKAIREPWEQYNQKTSALENGLRDLVMAQVKQLRGKMNDPQKAASLTDDVKKTLQGFRENEYPSSDRLANLEPAFDQTERERLNKLRQEAESLRKNVPAKPEFAHAMRDENPHHVRVFKRGNPGNQGDEAPRRFLLALSPQGKERPVWTDGSGRLQLARAIAAKDNPLTARVFVNRIWMQHFGSGIVRTPSDFGRQGDKPTHPELLDYLAATFMEDGWNVKKLHRRIVLSSTYRQSADVTPQKALADPENRWFSHQNRRRLDLEQMRDSLLAASGVLDTKQVGGKSIELWQAPYGLRRAVYGFVERQNLPQTFRTFDFASPDSTSSGRFRTTVPQQALFFMNAPLVVEQARAVLQRPDVKKTDGAARVKALYRAIYGRQPDADEVALGLRFTGVVAPRTSPAPDAWQYGYGQYDEKAAKVAGYTRLSHFTEERWQDDGAYPSPKAGWVALRAEGGHPGNSAPFAAVRRWTAPFDGTVAIGGKVKHPSDRGDGVRALIVSSRAGTLGDWVVKQGEKEAVATAQVKRGDTLDFVIDCRAEPSYDTFLWSPSVTRTDLPASVSAKSKRVWNARQDFGGPMPSSLTGWERYAQALLMSNEFLFVD